MTAVLKRAFISVSNKSGLLELARLLVQMNYEIYSIGETAAFFKQNTIPHACINRLDEINISHVDAVIVNLRTFDTVKNIDLDGPMLIRTAAKNYEHVAVVIDPADYPLFIENLRNNNDISAFRFTLAQKAFACTASYDSDIAHYLGCINNHHEKLSEFPLTYHPTYYKIGDLPNQKAALYSDTPNNYHSLQNDWFGLGSAAIPQSTLLQGEHLSYNDIVDTDLAWNMLKDLDTNEPACVIVKHGNPCGVATRYTLVDAYKAAHAVEPSATSEAIIAINKSLDLNAATCILNTQSVDVIIAPQVTSEALTLLQQKPAIRLLVCPYFQPRSQIRKKKAWTLKKITGGLLLQSTDGLASSNFKHIKKVKL